MLKRENLIFGSSILFITIIWVINLPYFDIAGDTSSYVTLGRYFWEHGIYSIDGIHPYGKYLPWLPLLSYPFTALLGPSFGMRFLGLLAGIGVLYVSYALLKRFFPKPVALAVVPLLALHHSFNYVILGAGTDLHYTLLFFTTAFFLHKGLKERPRWFLPMGIFMGLTCLSRYNGIFLFPFAGLVALYHYRTLKLPWQFWTGLTIGIGIFGSWFLRNWIVFGSPFYSEYRKELSIDILSVVTNNIWFYLNPIHNVLPLLFVCALVGLWKHWRGQGFLLWLAAAAAALSMIWTTPSMRYIFPVFPILFAFAAWGAWDLYNIIPARLRKITVGAAVFLFLVMNGAMLCVYSISICNVWIDQLGILPDPIPLTLEYRYSFSEARDFINKTAPAGAQILTKNLTETVSFESGVFRDDLVVSHLSGQGCPVYNITGPSDGSLGIIIFTSANKPTFNVEDVACSQ